MLVNQLREMQVDAILERIIYAEIPPRVEYKISKYGQTSLPPILFRQWVTGQLLGLNSFVFLFFSIGLYFYTISTIIDYTSYLDKGNKFVLVKSKKF